MAEPFRADVLTIFPEMVSTYASLSMLGRAQSKGVISVVATDVRNFALDKHKLTDDTPYGGGAGMVMKPEPLVAAIEWAKSVNPQAPVVVTTPRGRLLKQALVHEYAKRPGLILVCGRYEGIDERVYSFADDEVSVGDFVLTGGELAALCVIDATVRLLPGVLGNEASLQTESFDSGLLEYPQYTRPPTFRGVEVPAVLQGGDHSKIAAWRKEQSEKLTRERRPDLLKKA